jgi:helix-turn-helix protein
VLLVQVDGKDTRSVVGALTRQMGVLPEQLRRSLTWDRGTELATHAQFTIATELKVYFCDPQSPWQRGSNENTNGLLRQYLPKGTDFSQFTQTRSTRSQAASTRARERHSAFTPQPLPLTLRCVDALRSPRFSSQRRPRPGERLPDHLGGEGWLPSLCDVRAAWRSRSRSGYHAWERRSPSGRALSDAWLIEKIKAVYTEARGVYGSRRVAAELRLGQDIHVSRKRVRRLMRSAGISGLVKVKRGRTTIRVPGVRIADDLVERQFRPSASNAPWVADITYLRTREGGSTSPPCKTPSAAWSSAGRWPSTCAQSSSSRP